MISFNMRRRSIVLLIGICLLLAFCQRPRRQPTRETKLVIVGLDAATWTIIDPMLKQGKLPNIQRLMDQGSSGTLISLNNPTSAMVWTSIMTGKNPDKTGVSGFIGSSGTPVNASMRKVRDLPDLLSAGDFTVGFIGFWASWPAEQVNGWLVSDVLGYIWSSTLNPESNPKDPDPLKKLENATYPESLLKEILPLLMRPDQIPRADLERLALFNDEEWGLFQNKELFNMNDIDSLLKSVYLKDLNSQKVALYFAEKKKPEVLAVYFEGSDVMAHQAWRYMEPEYFSDVDPRKLERFHNTIFNYYQLLDQFIGELIKASGPNAAFLVISDHGMARGRTKNPDRNIDDNWSGIHLGQCNGIVIFSGPGIKKSAKVLGAGIMDVTPTVLYYLGLPVAKDMDGKPMPVFTDELSNKNRVKTINTYETKPRTVNAMASPLDPQIMKMLRSAGYIK
jgi:predicted AlkP superfamily phosphohydrolase/phosphomutase